MFTLVIYFEPLFREEACKTLLLLKTKGVTSQFLYFTSKDNFLGLFSWLCVKTNFPLESSFIDLSGHHLILLQKHSHREQRKINIYHQQKINRFVESASVNIGLRRNLSINYNFLLSLTQKAVSMRSRSLEIQFCFNLKISPWCYARLYQKL